jgi:hypothetical protein
MIRMVLLPLLWVAVLLLAGCVNTGVTTDDLGTDITAVEEAGRQPISPGMDGSTIWPEPRTTYNGVRQLPTAPLTLAYDLGLAMGTELGQLVSWTWGGQDAVSARAYSTWKEWNQVDRDLNPIPRWERPGLADDDPGLPGSRIPIRTGWTVGHPVEIQGPHVEITNPPPPQPASPPPAPVRTQVELTPAPAR